MGVEDKDLDYVGGIKVRTEDVGYAPAELVECGRCGRANPPTRESCLYCGAAAAAPGDRDAGRPLDLRALEAWENGFNVILRPSADNAGVRSAATLLDMDASLLERAARADSFIPLARVASEIDAQKIGSQLERLGLNTVIVNDVTLKAAQPNIRIRAMEFERETITATDFNTFEKMSAPAGDLALIVCGTIHESRSESIEQAKRKGQKRSLSSSETASDEPIMDIYFRGLSRGWQVRSKGFDFSVLGTEKGLLAADNFDRLKINLLLFQPSARLLDDHRIIRDLIAQVWPDEVRTDFEGIKSAGLWKAGFSKKVISNNFEQFNRYSRLQWLQI